MMIETPGAPPSLTMPDGQVVSLADWIHTDLRSALIVDPWTGGNSWELFTYGRAQPVSGTGISATRVHTNVPRSGDSGLPRDWEMYVTGWRAQTNVRLDQEVMDWAAETHVQFAYNQMQQGDTTLLDLLLHPQPMKLVWMRENMGYQVRVESDPIATKTFCDWLRAGVEVEQNVRDAVTELDTIIRLHAKSDGLTSSLRHVQKTLAGGRKVTVWVHLEGWLKRVVV